MVVSQRYFNGRPLPSDWQPGTKTCFRLLRQELRIILPREDISVACDYATVNTRTNSKRD